MGQNVSAVNMGIKYLGLDKWVATPYYHNTSQPKPLVPHGPIAGYDWHYGCQDREKGSAPLHRPVEPTGEGQTGMDIE